MNYEITEVQYTRIKQEDRSSSGDNPEGNLTPAGGGYAKVEVTIEIEDQVSQSTEAVCPPTGDTQDTQAITQTALPNLSDPSPAQVGIPTPSYPSPPVLSSGTAGWYSEDCEECCNPSTNKMIDYSNLKVAMMLDPTYSDLLSDSCIAPNDIVEEAALKGAAMVNTISLRQHSAKTLDNTRIKTKSDGTQVYKFSYETSFIIDQEEIKHLEVVSYVDIDFDKMSVDFEIEMPDNVRYNARSTLFNLKPAREKIIDNGKAVNDSTIFKNSLTNEYWDGPVHYHPSKGWMAGAKHTPFSHSTLIQEKVPNIKTKDHSVKNKLLNLNLDGILTTQKGVSIGNLNITSDNNSIANTNISEPFSSKSDDGRTRFIFYVDQANMVKSACRFPGLRDDTIYESGTIKSLQIYRQRGSENKSKSALGVNKVSDDSIENQSTERDLVVTSADSGVSDLVNSKGTLKRNARRIDINLQGSNIEEVGTIEELNVANLTKQRIFSVTDSEIATLTQGKFRYSVNLEVKDPSISYLNDKLDKICAAKEFLEDVLGESSHGKNYDIINKRFTDSYISRCGSKHTSAVSGVLIEIMDLIRVVTGRKKDKRTVNYILSQASIQAGSPDGIQDVIDIMGSFEAKIFSLLGSNLKIDKFYGAKSVNDSKVFSKSTSDTGLLTFEKNFDFIVDRSSGADFGYDYVAVSSVGFPVLSSRKYSERQEEENLKYFSDQGTPNAATGGLRRSVRSSAKRRAIGDFGNSYSFLTPAKIRTGETTLNLIGPDSEIDDLKKQTETVSRIIQRNNSSSKIYSAKDSSIDIFMDTLTDIGVAVYSDRKKSRRDSKHQKGQKYTSSSRSIFGENNFDQKNLGKMTEQQFCEEEEAVTIASVEKIITSINDMAAQTGVLTKNSSINRDQETRRRTSNNGFTTSLSINQFDLESDDSLVAKMTAGEIGQLPTSIKSLFFARETGSRNWLDFEKDLIQDTELKNVYRLNHSNVVKVEYLSSVRASKDGDATSRLTYRPLSRAALRNTSSTEPLLVRLSPVTVSKVGVGTDEGMEMDVYSENFLVVPEGPATSRAAGNVADGKAETTNYVKGQMDRLVFGEISQITTTPTSNNCKAF
jgi:hypothetical protein